VAETNSPALLLRRLPAAMAGDLQLQIVDAQGEVCLRHGADDGTEIEWHDGELVANPAAGRAVLVRSLSGGSETVVMSFDASCEEQVVAVLEPMFAVLEQRELAEEDMESIHASSLAMMEEVAMFNDTLPKLPTGKTDVDIAEMGVRALAVATSARRAMYVQYHPAIRRCEVLVEVEASADGRRMSVVPFDGEVDGGMVWQAIDGNGDALLRTVSPSRRLGPPGNPECLAEREVMVVPVSYGGDAQRVVLGALVLMDKRPNAYRSTAYLGSQETKLAIALASMLGSVIGTRMMAALDNELQTATDIQQQILPDEAACVPGFDLAGRCNNSGAVGGDYFDFVQMADGRTMVVVADVSGHHLASGMLMVGARSTLRALAPKERDLGALFDGLAAALYHDLMRTERFITAVGAALSPHQTVVELVNAGHNDSMIYRAATGEVELVPSDSTVLGFLPDVEHPTRRAELHAGDVLLLYTDGVVEATDEHDEMLGDQRLMEMLAAHASGSAESILDAVFHAVEVFADRSFKQDDVTAVVIKAVPTVGSES